jgi:flagellar protein FliO/FliZ
METLFLALRVLVALGAVLGLIWFVQRKLTRGSKKSAIASRFGGGAKRPIQVLGSHRLTAKASITVVEIDGVKLVLGVTEQGISVLEPAPAAPVVLAATRPRSLRRPRTPLPRPASSPLPSTSPPSSARRSTRHRRRPPSARSSNPPGSGTSSTSPSRAADGPPSRHFASSYCLT